jgi:hypothetical protein
MITVFSALATASDHSDSFSQFVDKSGNITEPLNDQIEFAYVGTWSVASKEEGGGIAECHNVYTQPATIESYKKRTGSRRGDTYHGTASDRHGHLNHRKGQLGNQH